MKKMMTLLAAILMLALCLTGCGGKDTLTLNVYNWGEYISDGSEGSFDTIREFETWYEETYGQKVTVNYSTYASNEDMYNKISSGAVSYDVIIPSDYMIAKMAEENLLHPLDFDVLFLQMHLPQAHGIRLPTGVTSRDVCRIFRLPPLPQYYP